MRSLFVRFFVSIFGAMLVAGAGFALVYAMESSGDSRHRGRLFLEDTLKVRGELLVDRIEDGESDEVEAELAELHRRTQVRLFLVLDDGRTIGPGTPSASSARLVRSARATRVAAHLRSDDPPGFFDAVPVEDAIVVVEFPPPPHTHSPFGALETVPIRIAIVVAVIALVASLLARYLSRPIRVLRDATDRLAQGDVTVRIGDAIANAPDELAHLGRDFDRMAEQLASLLESKERLLRDVSHELRSPLARLSVALGLARKRSGDGPHPELDRIELEAERLSELIGHVLTLSRLADDVPLVDDDVELGPLLERIVSDASFEASADGKTVALRGDVDVVVRAAPEALRWAIENVVRNAASYSPDDTEIEVRVDAAPASVRIVVRDRGPGVPDEALASIFRPFYRVGTDRDRKTGGAGVGLAISQRVVERSRGSIGAINADDGGLVVTIELPKRRDAR